jgi:hypothetical protein
MQKSIARYGVLKCIYLSLLFAVLRTIGADIIASKAKAKQTTRAVVDTPTLQKQDRSFYLDPRWHPGSDSPCP